LLGLGLLGSLTIGTPAVVLAALVFPILALARSLYGTVLSPMGVHSGMWLGFLFLASLGLSPRYQGVWSGQTWSALLLSEIAFGLGCVFVLPLRKLSRSAAFGRTRSVRRLGWFLCGVFTLGMVGFSIQVVAVGSISNFVSDPMTARERFFLPGVNYLYALLYLVPALSLIYWAQSDRFRKLALALGVVSLLAASVTVSRFGVLLAVGVGILGLAATLDSRAVRSWIVGLAVIGTLNFLLVGKWREDLGTTGKTAQERVLTGEVRLPLGLVSLVYPYFYVVSGFENFDHQVATAPRDAMGAYTFRAPLSLVGLDGDRYDHVGGARLPYIKGNWLNTSIYLADFWLDFGWPGVLAGPLLLGALTTVLFFFRFGSELLMVANSLSLYALFMTFFSNYFTYRPIVFLIGILLAGHMWTRVASPFDRRISAARFQPSECSEC
jgi:hypothetical protein